MQRFWVILFFIVAHSGFVGSAFAAESSCKSTGDLQKAATHCQLLEEPIFREDPAAEKAKSDCLCFYQEAYAIVEMVRAYQQKSNDLAKQFDAQASSVAAGQADQSQQMIAAMTAQSKTHHKDFADQLEIKYATIQKLFDQYFQSLNKLYQSGMNNITPEISGWEVPASKVPALWSVSVSKELLRQLQKSWQGSERSNGLRLGIRRIHREARTAEQSSGKIQSISSARRLSVGNVDNTSQEDILNDPTVSMSSPHFLTRGAGTVAGGAAGLLAGASKVIPGAVGMSAAGIVDMFAYEEISKATLFNVGAGAIVTAAKGTVAGVIVSGGIGALQYAGAKADALRHEYSEFSKQQILQNRAITSLELSKRWTTEKNFVRKTK